jgi:hypothetical protein
VKLAGYSHSVSAVIEFTGHELMEVIACCERSHNVRQYTCIQPGGWLFALSRLACDDPSADYIELPRTLEEIREVLRTVEVPVSLTLDWHQLDTLCRATESPVLNIPLQDIEWSFRRAMIAVGEEHRRIINSESPPADIGRPKDALDRPDAPANLLGMKKT